MQRESVEEENTKGHNFHLPKNDHGKIFEIKRFHCHASMPLKNEAFL